MIKTDLFHFSSLWQIAFSEILRNIYKEDKVAKKSLYNDVFQIYHKYTDYASCKEQLQTTSDRI
jgi:hypothetical protein